MVQCLNEMGQSSSAPKGRRKSLRNFMRKSASTKSHLSHTFALNDIEGRIELLNINIASEEELMTLPGVNREVARNIVEHRKAIGRFRKVEDLALVPGIGAGKLEMLRPEICVASKKNQSCASSRAPSYDSLRSADSRVPVNKASRLLNVNKASVFELQSIHGITQEIAAAIVHYRAKKRGFKKIEDLLKVKSIDHVRLNNIARFLTVDNGDNEASETEEIPRPSILTNGYTMPTNNYRCNGGPMKVPVPNGVAPSSLTDVFELLSAYSPRPILREHFKFMKNGEPVVRIASWNLHEFSYEKSNNLGVKEVICRTILENGWSIIAIQDVNNVTALRTICEELNKPRLRRVEEWRDHCLHNWNFCMLDVQDSTLGFLYDTDGGATVELLSLSEGPEPTKSECECLIAAFQVGCLNVQVVNLKLHNNADIEILTKQFDKLMSEDDMIMVCADFSEITGAPDKYLHSLNLQPVFPANKQTSYVFHKPESGPTHVSNILTSSTVERQLTGHSHVVRQGLTHLAIPNGWSWGGPASQFCPVYAELYLAPRTGSDSEAL